MVDNELGELRRSAVVMTFAPGAVVDFRAENTAISAVVAGLEEWDRSFLPPGLANPQVVFEPRLQRKLRVGGFRLPPVVWEGDADTNSRSALVAVRFPAWMQCPRCDTLARARDWAEDPGHAYRYCSACTAYNPGGRPVTVIPVRFVVACSAGHLDEFPWHDWVKHKTDCPRGQQPGAKLKLEARRAGLGGLILSCPSCGQERSMEGIFKANALRELGVFCKAQRPWLSIQTDPDGCVARTGEPQRELRVVQRGASNLFFPVSESALSIPPWADELQQILGMYWQPILDVTTPEGRRQFITLLAQSGLADSLRFLQVSADQLADLIEDRIDNITATDGEDLRLEEFRRLSTGVEVTGSGQKEFEIRTCEVPEALDEHMERLTSVTRLREVRALTGFTRIYPHDGGSSVVAPLTSTPVNWLPAIEVRGEGLFLSLREDVLQEWESRPAVVEAADSLRIRYEDDWHNRYPTRPPPLNLTARFLMLHTLAHALIRELTLECGYSTASLRERLYCRSDDSWMAGLLIYTATTDADGTLGGLARQGTPDRFERILVNAIEAQRWCSSDPLCIQGDMGADNAFSRAACHACCLVPETSCEHYNRFLDRALLVGHPDHPGIGFFETLR